MNDDHESPDFEQGPSPQAIYKEDRLRQVEIQVARIETKLESTSTKEDIQSVETSISKAEARILRLLIGVLVTAGIAITVAVIRTFL